MIPSVETKTANAEEKNRQIIKLEQELSAAWAHIHSIAEEHGFNEKLKQADELK